MEFFMDFFTRLYHFEELIRWGGLTALTIIIFAETGLLAGFFLPGDSLLVTAGLLAAVDGVLEIKLVVTVLCLAAVLGDQTGYLIGHFAGEKLFKKEDSLFFKRSHLTRTHAFFEKYGAKTIVLARFIPIVRTFAPTVAGVGRMHYRKFFAYNIVGGIAWVCSMTLLGFFLGNSIPHIEKKIHWIILLIILVSFLPIFFEWRSSRKKTVAVEIVEEK